MLPRILIFFFFLQFQGTLDALMSDTSDEVNQKVEKIFSEISRVLRFGGRYICISLAQDHILKTLMNYFPCNSWMFRLHKVIFF